MKEHRYISTYYRNETPGRCVCCSDTRGYGHIFVRAIHDHRDKSLNHGDILRTAMEKANVQDGDEFEVTIHVTGRRPFGDKVMVHCYLNGPHSTPTLVRVNPK